MPFLTLVSLQNGGTTTLHDDDSKKVITTMSAGPALSAAFEIAKRHNTSDTPSKPHLLALKMSPQLANNLVDLLDALGHTLSEELRNSIGNMREVVITQVRAESKTEVIAAGETIDFFFAEELEPFYTDLITEVEEIEEQPEQGPVSR